jgi:hypothetical protein
MTCDEAKKSMPLFLYGELSFEEEERLETHIGDCRSCADALARDKAMFAALDSAEVLPEAELVEECRADLHRNLAAAQTAAGGGFWDRIREGFTVHFHFAPALGQPLGALAMLMIGFFAARMLPDSLLGSFHAAGVVEPSVISRVRDVQPGPSGHVQIVVDETRQRVLTGSLEDQSIQTMLLSAAQDPSDAGVRVESVDLLKNRPQSAEIRKALLYAVQHDPNAGVRLKALDGLKDFADDPETRQVLTQVLLKDGNPGVRTQVIDLLIPHHNADLVSVLQEVISKENNDYIRMRCEKALREMNASSESY